MKKHNTVKVVLLTTLFLFVLTWILPAAYYSGEYVDQGRIQMGLFDIFKKKKNKKESQYEESLDCHFCYLYIS